jgi:hypothetical protein
LLISRNNIFHISAVAQQPNYFRLALLQRKNRSISTWLTEAAFIHPPLLQRFNILHPPGKAFNQLQ